MSVWDAVLKGDWNAVKAAVENGADIEEQGEFLGGTVLHYACRGGYFSITDYLIKRGAEVNSRDNYGYLPIHDACSRGHLDTVKLLITKGSDFLSKNNDGRTPLHFASLNGHTSVADYLIKCGAEVNSRDKNGDLPIHLACRRGHLDSVLLLITKGSDFTSTNNYGRTPLHFASWNGHTGVTKYLTQRATEAAVQLKVRQAVSETLKHGKKKNNRMSLLFIGQGRVGKTSLKKSLLGKASKEKEPSTIGIEFDVVEVQDINKSKPWKRAKDDQFIASEIYTDNVLGKEVARVMAESKEEPEEGRGGSAAGDEDDGVELEGESGDASGTKNGSEKGADDEVGQGDEDGAGARDGASDGNDCRSDVRRRGKAEVGKSETPKTMIDQLDYHVSDDLKRKIDKEMKNVESYRDDTMDTIRFMLGDVGGQSVFYDVHSIMLRLRTLFILVVDLSMSLDDEAQPKFVEKRLINRERDQENPLHETNFDYVTRWIAALRNLNSRSKEADSNSAPNLNLPKTILVFTKPDKLRRGEKLEEKLKKVTEALEKRFERIGCGSLIVAKYVINNTKWRNAYETDQLKALRETIFTTAQEILRGQEKTPVSWLIFERALDNLRRTEDLKDCPYITLDEARKLGEQCQVNETFEEAMTFFHEENIVVHFDGNPPMSDLVVLDAAWLVKLFTQVLTVAPKLSWGMANSRAWKKLTTEGVLDFGNLPNPLENHIQEKALKNIMVRVGLICHWGQNIYLVPSMVTKRWEESDIKKVLSSSLQPSLYLNFKGDTIPLGLYTRVLVEILKWARGDVEHDVVEMPEFHCNCCRVFKCENSIKYSVILIRHVTRIQVAISVDEQTIESKNIARSSVLSALHAAITKVTSCPCYQGVRYEFGLKCDLCLEEKTPCLRHEKEACNDDDCVCILSLECLKKGFAVCPRNRTGKISSKLHKTFWVNVTGTESKKSLPIEQDTRSKETKLLDWEIGGIAKRIGHNWKQVALRTKQFQSHEIDDMFYSRVNQDETSKALDMLIRYQKMCGTRENLVRALNRLKLYDVAKKVETGYFVDNE